MLQRSHLQPDAREVQNAVVHHDQQVPGGAERPRKSLHEICILIKQNSIEIISTLLFLTVLFKGAWAELGLPAIPWDFRP